jgi:methylphosphotriester-DNA--protein-cysteine methyltransferase
MNKRHLLKTLMVAAMFCTFTAFAGDGPVVKGNPKSKVYHLPACRHYNAKSSTVEFKSAAEAEKAGYKACKMCGKGKGKNKERENAEDNTEDKTKKTNMK